MSKCQVVESNISLTITLIHLIDYKNNSLAIAHTLTVRHTTNSCDTTHKWLWHYEICWPALWKRVLKDNSSTRIITTDEKKLGLTFRETFSRKKEERPVLGPGGCCEPLGKSLVSVSSVKWHRWIIQPERSILVASCYRAGRWLSLHVT